MPTGYTNGILEGEINNFKEFAMLCSKAFLIHLRDEPFNSEYKEREPSDYHSKAIDKAKKELEDIERLTDKEIIGKKRKELIESKDYHLDAKQKSEDNAKKLDSFLKKALIYNPPTDKHTGIKDFMIQQLRDTKKFDCNSQYHIEKLTSIENEIHNLNADNIRSEIKIKATKDIAYYTKENEMDLERCRDTNNWYNDYAKSLDF